MKLYYCPGASSLSIHALIEETGAAYEPVEILLRERAQFSDAYVGVNPKSQVPALERGDGDVLTEIVAIATWLAETTLEGRLMPKDAGQKARAYEAASFVVTNIHPQGFTRLGRTDKFTPREEDYETVRETGREIIRKGIGILESYIRGKPYVGEALSFADFIVFYPEYWAVQRLGWELPGRVEAHLRAMLERPSVQRALVAEGLPGDPFAR